MLEFFFHDNNFPFSVALLLMVAIAIIEGVGAVLGFRIIQVIDSVLPSQIEIPDCIETPSPLTSLLGWIGMGKIPLLMLLVLLLTFFGLSGLIVQALFHHFFSRLLPWYVAILPACASTFPLMRLSVKILNTLMINDDSSVAVSEESFIGKCAIIVLGSARKGNPSQAKLRDQFGQDHYILVEPESDTDQLESFSSVRLVRKEGSVFKAIKEII